MFIVTPIVGFCNCSMFCCTLLYAPSRFAIVLMGKRELVALLSLSSWCLVAVVWLFLAVPWGCLRFVIMVFSDHTHLLFFYQVFNRIFPNVNFWINRLQYKHYMCAIPNFKVSKINITLKRTCSQLRFSFARN